MNRRLGRSEISVSAIGMGCWAIGGPFSNSEGANIGWGEVDDNESTAALHAAFDAGITFFDTSDAYGAGHSERVIGKAFAGMRDKVIIATKFGNVPDEATKTIIGDRADEAYIRAACDASLRRLQTDYIDLYQLHLGKFPPDQAESVYSVLESLVDAGKIRSYAWSTDNVAGAAAFAKGKHCCAVQHRLNLFEDAPEMVALCEAHDLASINRSPLVMGLLSGKYSAESKFAADDIRSSKTYRPSYFVDGGPNPEMLARVESIRDILTSKGRTVAQGALAWLLARSEQAVPIPGIRTVKQAVENAAAMQFGPLDAAQMSEIESLVRG